MQSGPITFHGENSDVVAKRVKEIMALRGWGHIDDGLSFCQITSKDLKPRKYIKYKNDFVCFMEDPIPEYKDWEKMKMERSEKKPKKEELRTALSQRMILLENVESKRMEDDILKNDYLIKTLEYHLNFAKETNQSLARIEKMMELIMQNQIILGKRVDSLMLSKT